MLRDTSIATRLIGSASLLVIVAVASGFLFLSTVINNKQQEFAQGEIKKELEEHLNKLVYKGEIKKEDTFVDKIYFSISPKDLDPRFGRVNSSLYWQVTDLENGILLDKSSNLEGVKFLNLTEFNKLLPLKQFGPEEENLILLNKKRFYSKLDKTYVFTVATKKRISDKFLADIDEIYFLIIAFGIFFLLGLVLVVRSALAPLKQVRKSLTEITEGRTERLTAPFPREVRPLAEELNGLLDHTDNLLNRARSQLEDLAHALKTPLAVLVNECENPSPKIKERIKEQTQLMERHIQHYLARASVIKQSPLLWGRTPVLPVLKEFSTALQKIYSHIEIKVPLNSDLAFRGRKEDLYDVLGNLLENACKYGTKKVELSLETFIEGETNRLYLRLQIDDDGPGIPLKNREEIFGRGERLDETVQGSGLGLSIVRDTVSIYGGKIKFSEASLGGLRAILTLPGAFLSPKNQRGA